MIKVQTCCAVWSLGRVAERVACTCPVRTRGHAPDRAPRWARRLCAGAR